MLLRMDAKPCWKVLPERLPAVPRKRAIVLLTAHSIRHLVAVSEDHSRLTVIAKGLPMWECVNLSALPG